MSEDAAPPRDLNVSEDAAPPRDLKAEDPHDDENLVVGGHHDKSVPDISEDEINQDSFNEDPAVIAHVAAYNVEAEKQKVEEVAKLAVENPVVE